MNNSLVISVGRVAWGYVFLYLDFSLNSFNLLPDWACYAFVLWALPGLALCESSVKLLEPLAWLLLVVYAAEWVLPVFGLGTLLDEAYILGVVISVVSLYFHFQLLTNLADIAGRFNAKRQKSVLLLRNVRTVLLTLLALPWPIDRIEGNFDTFTGAIIMLVGFSLIIWTLYTFFGLRGDIAQWIERENPGDEA